MVGHWDSQLHVQHYQGPDDSAGLFPIGDNVYYECLKGYVLLAHPLDTLLIWSRLKKSKWFWYQCRSSDKWESSVGNPAGNFVPLGFETKCVLGNHIQKC